MTMLWTFLILYCIRVLVILEQYVRGRRLTSGMSYNLRSAVNIPSALDNLREFVLGDPAMFKLFAQLVDRAEPGLNILNNLAEEYESN